MAAPGSLSATSDQAARDRIEALEKLVDEQARTVERLRQSDSARKKAEIEVRETSERLHSVLESLGDGFFILDRDWRFTYLNPASERVLRRPRETLLGKRIGEQFPGAPGDVFYHNYRLARDEQRVTEFEAPYGPLGVWLEVRVHPTAEGLAVTLRDVTDRRLEREALRLSVDRFRGVARATSDAIWDWNIEADSTWWSDSMETLFGHSLADLSASTNAWGAYIHEDDRVRVLASIFETVARDGVEWSSEYRFARKDGTWAWVQDRAFVIRDATGRAVRMVGGMTDQTQRREAELELARLNRALRMRSACSESLIRATDEAELLTDVCRIAVDIGGYRMAWVGFADEDDRRSIRPVAYAGFEDGYLSEVSLSWSESEPGGLGPAGRAVRSGLPQILENLVQSPPQTPWHFRARDRGYHGIVSLPLRDRDTTFGLLGLYTAEARPIAEDEISLLQSLADDFAFGVMSLRSRSERQSLEDQLREAQKMEAIGTLAGGIAHDFNNILGAILGNTELARMDVEGNERALESLSEIRRAGLRAKELIRQILSFSRRDPSARRPVLLLPIAEESVRLLEATTPSHGPIHLHGAPDLPPINANPVQIHQVLLNLGTNAVHAMTGLPGSIEVRIDAVRLDENANRLHCDLRAGEWVRLSVIDNGHGMDEATRQRVFEPFFTTKPVGEGTGLGLPVVHGIVKDHDGVIVMESTPGTGTRFDVYFPAVTTPDARVGIMPSAPANEAAANVGVGHRILYIDDDAGLLSLIQRLLSRRGYEVEGYVDAPDAIERLRSDPSGFDLVLTDYNMPAMTGLDVARAVHGIRDDLPVAITSGYITEAMRSDAKAAGVRALIFKPDVVEELCDEVARVLAEVGKSNP